MTLTMQTIEVRSPAGTVVTARFCPETRYMNAVWEVAWRNWRKTFGAWEHDAVVSALGKIERGIDPWTDRAFAD